MLFPVKSEPKDKSTDKVEIKPSTSLIIIGGHNVVII